MPSAMTIIALVLFVLTGVSIGLFIVYYRAYQKCKSDYSGSPCKLSG